MINLGLDAARMQVLTERLRSPHWMSTQVHVLDMNQNFVSDITNRLLDGSVDIDANGSITRSAKLEMLDLDNSLYFSMYDPASGSHYYKQMVRVWYGVGALGPDPDWMYIPVFTGPVTSLSRDGAMVSMSAMGKEVLAQDGVWTPWQWPTGWGKRDVIVNGLALHVGEMWYDTDAVGGVLGAPLAVAAGDDLWAKFWNLADGMGCQLFYNGWGNLRLRTRPLNPIFTFTDEWITEKPEITYDSDNLVNAVRVEGGVPQGFVNSYVVSVAAPPSHPLSPVALGRAGVPRFLPEFISDDSLLTQDEVISTAQNTLADRLLSNISANFTSFTVPFLEEGDVVCVNGSGYFGYVRTDKLSIPLVRDAEMSFGFLSTAFSTSDLTLAAISVSQPREEEIKSKTKKKRKKRKLKDKKDGKKRNRLKMTKEGGN